MTHPDADPDFADRLAAGLSEALRTSPGTRFTGMAVHEGGPDRTEFVLDGHADTAFVVSVHGAGVDPGPPGIVDAGRSESEGDGDGLVASCNVNDLFLSDRTGGRYYLDLRGRQAREVAGELLDAAGAYAEEGRLPRQPDRDRAVGRLRSFHAATWPAFRELAASAMTDARFADSFDRWVATHGHGDLPPDERLSHAARQYALLVAGEALAAGGDHGRDDGRTRSGPVQRIEDTPVGTCGGDGATTTGEPNDGDDPGLFDLFPGDERTRAAAADLAATLDRTPGGDLLGAVYEDTIPDGRRDALGQYYTHPTLAEAVVRWALPDAEGDPVPRVLDPAAGSGTFTVEAFEVLADRFPAVDDATLLGHLVPVDVNRFPLRLTAANLARVTRDGRSADPDARHASFFDLDPVDVGPVDAVVGNPPYVRHEDLRPGVEHFRRHLRSFERPGGGTYHEVLGEKSDAYVYFATHAARFLRDGGRLGLVVPTKWLATDYGEAFQRFLFEQFRLAAVVGFDGRAFPDALVDACLLLAERSPDPDERAGTVTRFVRLTEPAPVPDILDAVDRDLDPADDGASVEAGPDHRTAAVRQSAASSASAGKLAHLLSAPEAAIELVEDPALARLDDLATVAYGNKTGANEFFFLDDGDVAEWGIADRFLAPAVKSPREVDGRVVDGSAVDRYLLDVRDYVRALDRADERGVDRVCERDGLDRAGEPDDPDRDGPDRAAAVVGALRRDGHAGLADYVEHGERAGYHERATCASRPVWFDLGELERPEVVHPKFFDETVTVMWNRDRVAPSNAVDCLTLAPGVDEVAALGVLNSTVHELLLECWGRAEGGGALQLMTYELSSLPVVDPRDLDGDRREALRAAARRLLDGDDDARDDVDRVLLDALDADLTVAELRTARATLVERRVRNGTETEVPVRAED